MSGEGKAVCVGGMGVVGKNGLRARQNQASTHLFFWQSSTAIAIATRVFRV